MYFAMLNNTAGSTRRSRHSHRPTQSAFMKLPREIRDTIYEWLLLICNHEKDKNSPLKFSRRDKPILSEALSGKPALTLRRLNPQIQSEYLNLALKNCKVIGSLIDGVSTLVKPFNSIPTFDLGRVRKYEMVIRHYDPPEDNMKAPEVSANAVVRFLPQLRELTLHLVWNDITSLQRFDANEAYTSDRFMEFSLEDTVTVHTLRKVVTIGFWNESQFDTEAPFIFEYKDRTDRLNMVTRKFEQSSCHMRDLLFWSYINDIKDACDEFYSYFQPHLPFEGAHAEIQAAYDTWLTSGKPNAKDVPQVKVCNALREMDRGTASSSATLERFIKSLYNNRYLLI